MRISDTKMKNKKGFIQIPLLIAVIVVVFAVGGGAYLGIKQYQISLKDKAQIQQQVEAQQTALKRAQEEIEKLKKEQEIQPKDFSISALELEPYLTGVGEVECFGDEQKTGSASLWNLGEGIGSAVLTNYHVISGDGNCNITIGDSSTDTKHAGMYRIDKSHLFSWNPDTDISALKIIPLDGASDFATPIPDLNYRISSLRRCSVRMQLGSSVVIVGFPAFSKRNIMVAGHLSSQSSRTITNGIISAHDTSLRKPIGNLPYPNYYISAKIDSGNSGGIALSKDASGLCVLGLPTWLSVGNYETQGVVQNIHNIFYKN